MIKLRGNCGWKWRKSFSYFIFPLLKIMQRKQVSFPAFVPENACKTLTTRLPIRGLMQYNNLLCGVQVYRSLCLRVIIPARPPWQFRVLGKFRHLISAFYGDLALRSAEVFDGFFSIVISLISTGSFRSLIRHWLRHLPLLADLPNISITAPFGTVLVSPSVAVFLLLLDRHL